LTVSLSKVADSADELKRASRNAGLFFAWDFLGKATIAIANNANPMPKPYAKMKLLS
jgi:hypothetical protein